MKRNLFSLMAGSALAVGSATAFALPPSTVPDVEIFASGASATDNLIKGLFDNMCQAGTLDVYLDNSATPGSSHRAFFCTIGAPTLTTPRNVLFHKTSIAGSTNGVVPVANGTELAQMVINNAGVNGSSRATPCALTATPNVYSCSFSGTGETQLKPSDMGTSDVEPALFRGINVPSGGSAITPAQQANLAVSPLNAVVFGITVTEKLRNRLQFVQGLVVGAEDAANMPTLTRSQITGAFAQGGLLNWSSFRVPANHSNPALRGLAIDDAAVDAADPANENATTQTQVHICRRTQGSGTQAQFNTVFMRAPCVPGSVLPLVAPASRVTLNSSTGNLTTCMNNKNNAVPALWAFGIHSTENVPSATDKFRFVKIHGVTPDIKNAADGQYEDWVEQTVQWRVGPGLTNSAALAPTGDTLTILNKIKTDGATPSVIAAENTKFVHTWGQGGYLATPSSTLTGPNQPAVDGIFVVGTPVNTATRGGDSCRVPRVFRSTAAAHGDHLP